MAPDILEILYHEGGSSGDPSVYISDDKWIAGDLWSLGEVIVRIMTGKATFRSHEHVMRYFSQINPFPSSELADRGLSLDVVDFIQKVMAAKPINRISSKSGLLHDWVNMSTDLRTTSLPLSSLELER
jgi:serine/threonine protein kinase